MNSFTYKSRSIALAALVAVVLACTDDNENPVTIGPDVSLKPTSLGNVLTGERGKTLYFFAGDVDGKANCTGACSDTWPVFYKESLILGNDLAASNFSTITRTDGTKQTAYKGWPLYYYKSDTQTGDVKGENVNNVWLVAKPNYAVLLASRQLVGQDTKLYTFDKKEGTGNSLFLTDSVGRTLYAFANDRKNVNRYTKEDFSNNPTWPLFNATIGEIPSALNKADFSTITVFGRKQLTYKGWPLYYFGPDQDQRGSTKGVSVPRPGVWPVVNSTTPEAPSS